MVAQLVLVRSSRHMKRFALLIAAVLSFAVPALAQPHASREAVVAFLRREGILNGETVVDEAI